MTRPIPVRLAAFVAFVALAAASPATAPLAAQKPTPQPGQGVRLGLTYAVGTRPGVIVLPVDSAGGDSVRVILQRDLDFDDRATVIALDAPSARRLMPPRGGDRFNYALFSKLGVAAIVRPERSLLGLTVAIYDVAAKRRLRTADFPIGAPVNSRAWRMELHRVSDEIGRWIFGTPGAATTRVLYSGADHQIWIIDSDGANPRRLTNINLAMSPAWAPDTRRFAFSGFTARGSQIAIYDLASGSIHYKEATKRGLNITPAFAPDGHTIAYATGDANGTDVVIADVSDNVPARRLTVGRGSDNTSPVFSPDGRQIAFMSGRAGHPEIYTMDSDGTNVQLLTEFNYGEQAYRASPDWSSDGRTIAYESRIDGAFQIMTIDLRDRSTKQYTSDGENEDPSWAPDGRHLVFSSTRTGPRQLWVLDTESGRLRQLTHAAGSRLPAWSPLIPAEP